MNFIQHNANRADLKLCPLCRAPIDEAAVQKKVYQEVKPTDMKTEDAFALAGVPEEDDKKGGSAFKSGPGGEPVASEANLIRPSDAASGVPIVLPPGGPSAAAAGQNDLPLAANASGDVPENAN